MDKNNAKSPASKRPTRSVTPNGKRHQWTQIQIIAPKTAEWRSKTLSDQKSWTILIFQQINNTIEEQCKNAVSGWMRPFWKTKIKHISKVTMKMLS